MNKLTSKPLDNKNYRVRQYIDETPQQAVTNCINKLGKLEDLEEELGCPLEVVFKALEEGIVINENGYVNTAYDNKEFNAEVDSHYDCLKLSKVGNNYYFEEINHHYGNPKYGDIGCCVRLSNYQKTWWLKGEKE